MRWRVALKIATSAALIAALLWRTPISEIAASLSVLDATSLLGALLLISLAWWISALRLWLLVPDLRLRNVVQMTFVALYYGTVLPGQVAGDAVKAYRLSHGQNSPGQAAAATLIDRIIATFALLFLGAGAVPWIDRAPSGLAFSFTLAATTILFGVIMLAQPRVHELLVRWIRPKERARIRLLLARLVDGLHRLLQHPSRLFACFVLALVFHGLCTAIQIVIAHALGFSLPTVTWLLVYAGVSLLLILPITIAGVGLRETGYVGLLGVFGVAATQALSLSFVLFSLMLFGALLGWIADLTSAKRG